MNLQIEVEAVAASNDGKTVTIVTDTGGTVHIDVKSVAAAKKLVHQINGSIENDPGVDDDSQDNE